MVINSYFTREKTERTFKPKYDSNGEIEKYKTHLVAKGIPENFRSDYNVNYVPVVTYTEIRSFLAYAAYKNPYIAHINVKAAFLQRHLNEDFLCLTPKETLSKKVKYAS